MENEISHLNLEEIIPKNNIPHEQTDDYLQNNLVESIKNHGIIQPIVVRKNNNKYEIVDGNRRYFAAIKAGLNKIPALVKNDNESVTKFNLRDNLYNQGLSPIEEAKKYKEILEKEQITQEELSKRIGKSQSALANKLRLLNLPYEVQEALNRFEISERHARSLLTIKNEYVQLELLKKIKEKKLTVRELDGEIKNMGNMFIPEEFSNKNINNESNNMNYNQISDSFIPQNNINYNQSNSMVKDNNIDYNQNSNMFIPDNNNTNVNNNSFNNSMNSNTFISNNDPVLPIFNNNIMNNDMNQMIMPTDDGGMNPFFTSNDYVAPTPNNNDKNMNSLNNSNQPNPFSSIRMNTNNISNNINNSLSNYNENSKNDFDINDYKLPEYDNNYDNNVSNSFENTDVSTQVSQSEMPSTNEYKYVEDNPNYVSVDKPDGVSSVDDVIEILRGTLDKIKNGKIRVDTEEIDYDDTYQITIRIDKKGDFL